MAEKDNEGKISGKKPSDRRTERRKRSQGAGQRNGKASIAGGDAGAHRNEEAGEVTENDRHRGRDRM